MSGEVNKGLPPQFLKKPGAGDDDEDGKKKEAADKKEDAAEKAGESITEEALLKSLDKVVEIVNGAPDARKRELFEKGMKGAISAEESHELAKLMAGQADRPLSASVSKALDASGQGEEFQKAIRVNDFLEDFHLSMSKSLQDVAEYIEKGDARTQERTVVLAKGMLDIGRATARCCELVKALSDQLNTVLQHPARGPKSLPPTASDLNKGFGGGQVSQRQPGQLMKGDVLNLMGELNEASPDGLSKSGEPYISAITKYEQLEMISPEMQAEIRDHYLAKRANGTPR